MQAQTGAFAAGIVGTKVTRATLMKKEAKRKTACAHQDAQAGGLITMQYVAEYFTQALPQRILCFGPGPPKK